MSEHWSTFSEYNATLEYPTDIAEIEALCLPSWTEGVEYQRVNGELLFDIQAIQRRTFVNAANAFYPECTTPCETVVYRFLDAEDRLLYVGQATSLEKRQKAHEKRAAWWPQVARTEHLAYPTRAQAMFAERLAIKHEEPLHNTYHNGKNRASQD